MIDIIVQRFEQEKDTKTYRRISSDHPISIYLGYNSKGNKSLVITEKGEEVTLASTILIETQTYKRYDEKLSIEFALLDDRFSSMFYKFCEDIICSSEDLTTGQAIKFVADRWNAWRLMFKNNSNDILSDSSIQGLIGELLFLDKMMIMNYGIERSIKAWDGPLGNPKDFTIDDTWYEIKTTTPGNSIIKISSLDQLDSNRIGELVIVRIEKTNTENSKALNLNMMVEKIKKQIDDMAVLKEYLRRLSEVGYLVNDQYEFICFEYKGIEKYLVDENFPRIRRINIPNAILKVQYDVNIAKLGEC